MYVPSKRNRDYIKLQLPPQLKQCKYAGTYRCMDARTDVRTYIRTYLCLFRSKDCPLQGNTDHVHTEVNGVHHCTILLGLQGVGGGASERHALSYTWRESHTHCSAPFCPSPFSRWAVTGKWGEKVGKRMRSRGSTCTLWRPCGVVRQWMQPTMWKEPPPIPQPRSNTRSPGCRLRDLTNSRVVSGPPEHA